MDRLSGLRRIVQRVAPTAMPPARPLEPAHWSTFVEPVDATPKKEETAVALREDNETTNIEELIPLALDAHYKILKNTRLIESDDDYILKAKLVLATAQSVLSTQIKVDENRLKRRKQDDIMTILSDLRAEEKKQAALELSATE